MGLVFLSDEWFCFQIAQVLQFVSPSVIWETFSICVANRLFFALGVAYCVYTPHLHREVFVHNLYYRAIVTEILRHSSCVYVLLAIGRNVLYMVMYITEMLGYWSIIVPIVVICCTKWQRNMVFVLFSCVLYRSAQFVLRIDQIAAFMHVTTYASATESVVIMSIIWSFELYCHIAFQRSDLSSTYILQLYNHFPIVVMAHGLVTFVGAFHVLLPRLERYGNMQGYVLFRFVFAYVVLAWADACIVVTYTPLFVPIEFGTYMVVTLFLILIVEFVVCGLIMHLFQSNMRTAVAAMHSLLVPEIMCDNVTPKGDFATLDLSWSTFLDLDKPLNLRNFYNIRRAARCWQSGIALEIAAKHTLPPNAVLTIEGFVFLIAKKNISWFRFARACVCDVHGARHVYPVVYIGAKDVSQTSKHTHVRFIARVAYSTCSTLLLEPCA